MSKTALTARTDEDVRRLLVIGLNARREEIEDVARAQISAILGKRQVSDPEYTEGLRETISAALDLGLTLIEQEGQENSAIPPTLLTQARLAARNGLGLEVVLRRYVAGYALFDDFVMQEAASSGVNGEVLVSVLRTPRTVFNRILREVSEEYTREAAAQHRSEDERVAQRVQSLLDCKSVDTSGIPYEFKGQHLGVVSMGNMAPKAIRELARALDYRLLTTSRSDGAVYAWLGSGKARTWADIENTIYSDWPSEIPVAFGELESGQRGWRLTHQQALAAFPIALRMANGRPVRYAKVALEASICHDDLLMASLRRRYLDPLAKRRNNGEITLQTLRAFLDAGRSITTAAAKLSVRRQTVRYRIEGYEALIGQSLDECAELVWVALRLEALGFMRTAL